MKKANSAQPPQRAASIHIALLLAFLAVAVFGTTIFARILGGHP
jgi:hypothetical protein